jgi:hypothetical protein
LQQVFGFLCPERRFLEKFSSEQFGGSIRNKKAAKMSEESAKEKKLVF